MDESNRSKRKRVADGVRKLRAKPGWDPAKHVTESPEDALMRLDQESRSGAVYSQGEVCEACAEARTDAADESALCPTHLAAAMGF